MSHNETGYAFVREASLALLRGDACSTSFQVGETRIMLSKVRVLESAEPLPDPYPHVDLPAADDYSTWLK